MSSTASNPRKYHDDRRTIAWGQNLNPEVVEAMKVGEVFTLLDRSGKPFSRLFKDSYGTTREAALTPQSETESTLQNLLGIPLSPHAGVVKQADTPDLKSGAEMREGSNPSLGIDQLAA